MLKFFFCFYGGGGESRVECVQGLRTQKWRRCGGPGGGSALKAELRHELVGVEAWKVWVLKPASWAWEVVLVCGWWSV